MSRKPMAGFLNGPGVYYVCATWQQCRAKNLMWQAVAEEVHHLDDDWECGGCGKPQNVQITWDEAKKEVG